MKKAKNLKNQLFRIMQMISVPKYASRVIHSVVSLALAKSMRSVFPHSGRLRSFYTRHKQRLLLDECVQENKSSTLHSDILRVCLTYQCNRDCTFCYAKEPRETIKEHMSIEDFEFLTDWAKSQGWRSFRLLGGEPTFYPQFRKALDIAHQKNIPISFSTNGIYDSDLNSSFTSSLVRSINFSYPQNNVNAQTLDLFFHNLKSVLSKKIPVVLSWIMHPEGKDWQRIVDFAKTYSDSIILRFSLVLPGDHTHITVEQLKGHIRTLGKQILDIARTCRSQDVVFFFYRPVLRCMFSTAELDYLQSISPFLFDTHCVCSFVDGNYSKMVTVNPDLSCYLCPVVVRKGIKISPQTTREDINRSFKNFVGDLCMVPFMESCNSCEFFTHYKQNTRRRLKDLADRTVCQGGCFGYRNLKHLNKEEHLC